MTETEYLWGIRSWHDNILENISGRNGDGVKDTQRGLCPDKKDDVPFVILKTVYPKTY